MTIGVNELAEPQQDSLEEGKRTADRLFDTTLIEAAVYNRLDDFEILVGLWDAAIAAGYPVDDLEKEMRPIAETWLAHCPPSKGNPRYPLTREWIARMRTALNNDRRRDKWASELIINIHAHLLGMTRCQYRAAMAMRS